MSLLGMHVKYISESKNDKFLISSLEKEMTLYFSNMNTTLSPLIVNFFILFFRKTISLLCFWTTPFSSLLLPMLNIVMLPNWKLFWLKIWSKSLKKILLSKDQKIKSNKERLRRLLKRNYWSERVFKSLKVKKRRRKKTHSKSVSQADSRKREFNNSS